MATMYFDDDADLKHLDDKVICIIGYGNQGRSQALNLRDSGLNVIVGSPSDRSYDRALEDGFEVHSPAEGAEKADVIFLLIPDEALPAVYLRDIEPGLKAGNVLVFASGYNITYCFIDPQPDVDVVMIAPRMIGHGVRTTYLSGESFPSLIAVEQVASALLMAPEIIEKIVVIWTAGYPSTVAQPNFSFNTEQDMLAARLLFDSGVPLVYLPGFHIGAQLRLSLPEMEQWVKGKGDIGDYLFYLYTHNPIHPMLGIDDHFGRTWVIWDLINIAWYPLQKKRLRREPQRRRRGFLRTFTPRYGEDTSLGC